MGSKLDKEIQINNLEHITLENDDYRRVIYTNNEFQLVLMSLKPGETIPNEKHEIGTQFIRVESGLAMVNIHHSIKVENRLEYFVEKTHLLEDGMSIIIPSGVYHEVINDEVLGKFMDLKLYSIYIPPEHKENNVNSTKMTF